MKFMSIGYYTSGVSNLKYHKGDLSIQHQKKRKKRSKKGGRNILNIPERFTAVSKTCVLVQLPLMDDNYSDSTRRLTSTPLFRILENSKESFTN
jgi:hypothetical protein